MTQRRIFISEAEGKTVLYFDTGLDPRSFARTRLAQCFTDPGFIVSPDGSSKIWRASGVSEVNGCMCIWGAAFNSERLDLLIEEEAALQAALQAVVFWIRGKLFLGETHSVLEPGAAFIVCKDGDEPRGSVLFLPEILSGRCLLAEGEGPYRFICPDLSGLESAAFCAAAMLYKILTGTAAYPNLKNCYQDMREGVFLPPRLAAPGLDEKLCELIQTALFLPVAKKRTGESGASVLGGLLKCLIDKGGETAAVTSLIKSLSTEEKKLAEREKDRFIKKKNRTARMRRFVMRNKAAMIGCAAALLIAGFVAQNVISSRFGRPTTKGMDSYEVINAYYDAFSVLDHTFMEACIWGADKIDIDVAINYYVIYKVRQANEIKTGPLIVSAKVWKERGGELPAPDVFGITGLSIIHLSGNEDESRINYRVNYTLWFPNETVPSIRSDELTLMRNKKRNWQIIEIERTIK